MLSTMNNAPKQAPPQRSSMVVPAVVIGVLVIVAAITYKGLHSSSEEPAPPATAAVPAAPAPRPSARPVQTREESDNTEAPAPAPVSTPGMPAPRAVPPETGAMDPKELVDTLAALTGKEPITADTAQKWKESLQQLIHSGAASVPAIQKFLAQNLDANYAGVSGADDLGYGSLRSAMLDALAQIGGPESTQAMLQILQTSVYPTDIASLATTLEAQGNGQYQQAILDAVRQQMNLGVSGQLGSANVLPLFQVLSGEAANGASITADLAQYAQKWPYYSAIALAALPDGAGVSSLTQMAQGTGPGSQVAAAQALAEMAPQNPEALTSLLDLAKGGQVPDSTLALMAPYLAGRQYQLGPPQDPSAGGNYTFHMAEGNQDFSASDPNLTQAQISHNISVIDQLLQAIPATDTAAQDALQEQRTALAAKQQH
jgi:HEAT repeat protein